MVFSREQRIQRLENERCIVLLWRRGVSLGLIDNDPGLVWQAHASAYWTAEGKRYERARMFDAIEAIRLATQPPCSIESAIVYYLERQSLEPSKAKDRAEKSHRQRYFSEKRSRAKREKL